MTLGQENGLYSSENRENDGDEDFFFMIRSCFLNTRIERNWPRSEAEFPILMRSVAHHPEQESGINLEIHSPRLCGGERRHNTMKNREAGVKRERIGGDGETRG